MALESIIESTTHLSNVVLSSVQNDILNLLKDDENYDKIKDVFVNRPTLFEGLETLPLQRAYIERSFQLLPFKEIVLGNRLQYVKKGQKRLLVEKNNSFIYFSIVDSLKQMLQNKKLREILLLPPNFAEEGFYHDLCDGRIYKDDPYFDKPNSIALIIYHDEVEVCNPLGSKASKHKLDMYYFTVANIPPKFRSRHSAVRLIAVVYSSFVKEYGYNKILEQIVADLRILFLGVKITYENESLTVFGKVVICTGDTLGQNLWGGFKEGVGGAFQKCRHCYCDFNLMQECFHEKDFLLRTKSLHERDVDALENSPNKQVQDLLSLIYGVTTKSSLMKLTDFDITTQLPQDIMHTIAEGVLQYEVRYILLFYIRNKYFTLDQLNAVITAHAYGYSETSDKPSPLHASVFTSKEAYKLKYNAAQARLFLRMLPFFLNSLIELDIDDGVYMLLVNLIKIVQIIYSPTISSQTIKVLENDIETHLKDFKIIFPDVNITPKQHYLVHIPRMIAELGPPVRSACYSFEAAHKYFKRIAQKQNFKNLCLSISQRYQRLLCADFGFDTEYTKTHPLFSSEIKYGVLINLKDVQINYLRTMMNEHFYLPGITLPQSYRLSWVSLCGTKYVKGGCIIVDVCKTYLLPVFGEIINIWLVGPYVYFEYKKLETLSFSTKFQAFHIRRIEGTSGLVPPERLVDHNIIHLRTIFENYYLQPKYFVNDILKYYSNM